LERNPMQLKRRYLLLPLLFLILGYMVFSVYNDVRNRTTAEFNAQQMLLAKQAAKGIWSLFDHYHEELTYLSSLDTFIPFSKHTRALMKSFLKRHSDDILAVTAVDAKGMIAYTVPFNKKAIGADIFLPGTRQNDFEHPQAGCQRCFYGGSGVSDRGLSCPHPQEGCLPRQYRHSDPF